MAIKFTCNCGKEYTLKDSDAGRRAACKICGHKFTIPISAPQKAESTVSNDTENQNEESTQTRDKQPEVELAYGDTVEEIKKSKVSRAFKFFNKKSVLVTIIILSVAGNVYLLTYSYILRRNAHRLIQLRQEIRQSSAESLLLQANNLEKERKGPEEIKVTVWADTRFGHPKYPAEYKLYKNGTLIRTEMDDSGYVEFKHVSIESGDMLSASVGWRNAFGAVLRTDKAKERSIYSGAKSISLSTKEF